MDLASWHEARAAALHSLSELDAHEAMLFARTQQALADFYAFVESEPERRGMGAAAFVALELSMELGIAQVTATRRLERALHFTRDLPDTLVMLGDGQLSVAQGLILHEETLGLPTETCRAVEQQVLVGGATRSTPGELRAAVRKALIALDEKNVDERREARRRERRAFVSPRPDGDGFLGVTGPAEATSRFFAELTTLCHLTFGSDDVRTLDQQRSDLALSLTGFALAARSGHGPSLRHHLGLRVEAEGGCSLAHLNHLTAAQLAKVHTVVLVPVETALGLSSNPAELVGYGPITAEHARELMVAAELRHGVVDRATGRLIGLSDQRVSPPAGLTWPTRHVLRDVSDRVQVDTGGHHLRSRGGPPPRRPARPGPRPGTRNPSLTLQDQLLAMLRAPQPVWTGEEPRHDPSRRLVEFLLRRDTRCSGPGCSMPASRCDLDHWVEHPLGATAAWNLGPLSRRCHNAKTHGGWSLTPHPDGSVTWTSPFGQSWTRPSRTRPVDLTRLVSPVGLVPPTQRPGWQHRRGA